VAEAREWRTRLGGTLCQLWPYAAARLVGLRMRLPRMEACVSHARAIAAALSGVPGVRVVPDPPQTPMMHVLLGTSAATVTAGILRRAIC
jgi:threonine aldolase